MFHVVKKASNGLEGKKTDNIKIAKPNIPCSAKTSK
jgi:hypothetical protein